MSKDFFDVSKKIIVVTGGLGIIGREFCLEFYRRNAIPVVLDLDVSEASRKKAFGDLWQNIPAFPVDVKSKGSVSDALSKIEREFGAPHVLFNNAALDSPPDAPASETGPFEEYSEESFDKVMDVNVKGVFLCSQVIGAAMAKAGRGSIVNISSIYGMVSPDQRIYEYRKEKTGEPFIKPVAYSVSKSALYNLTRYLSTYWAKRNVRVNTITFAGVFNNQDKNFLDEYTKRVPMGRMAKVQEYLGPAVFLASEASSYMTGSNLVIDGGWTAW